MTAEPVLIFFTKDFRLGNSRVTIVLQQLAAWPKPVMPSADATHRPSQPVQPIASRSSLKTILMNRQTNQKVILSQKSMIENSYNNNYNREL